VRICADLFHKGSPEQAIVSGSRLLVQDFLILYVIDRQSVKGICGAACLRVCGSLELEMEYRHRFLHTRTDAPSGAGSRRGGEDDVKVDFEDVLPVIWRILRKYPEVWREVEEALGNLLSE
jgi:hypothetical protein